MSGSIHDYGRKALAVDEEVARAANRHGAAKRERIKAERRAGRALREREEVEAALNEAIDVFADGDWGDMDLVEIRKTGGRIARFADQLHAAEYVSAYVRVEAETLAELRRLR